MVTVLGSKPWFKLLEVLHESLEDGTLPFHNIIALSTAIDTHERLYGPNSMETISRHTSFLGKRLYDSLTSLRHPSGIPVCQIYKGAESFYGDSTTQGATVAFNVVGPDGKYIPYTSIVEKLANERDIYVRSGQLCNLGGIAGNLGFETWHMTRLWSYGHRCGGAHNTGTEIVNGKPTGVVRVSLGAMTTVANIGTLIDFLGEEFMLDNYPSPLHISQEQTYDLAVRAKVDRGYQVRVKKELVGQGLSEENLRLNELAPFAPSISWGSRTDTQRGTPSSYRAESSVSSIRQYNESVHFLAPPPSYRGASSVSTTQKHSESVHSLVPPPRRAAPPMPRKPVNTDFDAMGLEADLVASTPRSGRRNGDEGGIPEEEERRGLKKLWKHKERKSGSISTLA